jgi:hypothetical protein
LRTRKKHFTHAACIKKECSSTDSANIFDCVMNVTRARTTCMACIAKLVAHALASGFLRAKSQNPQAKACATKNPLTISKD